MSRFNVQDAMRQYGGIQRMGRPGEAPEDLVRFTAQSGGGNGNPLAAQTIETLTNLSLALKPRGFIADAMLPPMMVPKAQGYYWSAGTEWFKIPNSNTTTGYDWAPGNQFAEDGVDFSRASYALVPYALQVPTDRYTADQDDESIQRAQTNAMWARTQMLLLRESLVAAAVNNTSTFTSVTLSGENQWFDGTDEGTTSDPNDDIWTGCQNIIDAGGMPTDISMSLETAKRLVDHSQNVAEWRDTNQPGTPTVQWVMDKVMPPDLTEQGVRLRAHVGSAQYETAGEGVTSSRSYIWGNDVCIVANAPPGNGVATVGFNLVQKGWSGKVEQFYSNERSANIFRIWEVMQAKIMNTSCGYVIENAIS